GASDGALKIVAALGTLVHLPIAMDFHTRSAQMTALLGSTLAKRSRSHYVRLVPTDPMDDLFEKNRPQRPAPRAADRVIAIRGAREHNLKNIDVELPRDRLVVFTGLSGSGKSSLAFDTIYAEGQRRYVESLSAYARQFLEMMQKPDVDQIDGLS